MKDDIVIVGAARTPVGAFNGAFGNLPAHELGKVAIADFENYDNLTKVGASRFDAGDERTITAYARLNPGHIERSSSEPVQEMVNMIESARAYQLNAQMVSLQDQSIGRLISQVAS